MAHLLISHRVGDYDRSKSVFNGFVGTRRPGGEKSLQYFCSQNELSYLALLFEWETFENAHTFPESDVLKSARAEAGVKRRPNIVLLDESGQGND